MSYALDGGKLLVHTLWNWVLTLFCASRPDAETRSSIVRTLLILFIDGDTASCLSSFELRKILCFVQDICTHLVKCHLNCVHNALKGNSTVRLQLLKGSGNMFTYGGWKNSFFWFWICVTTKLQVWRLAAITFGHDHSFSLKFPNIFSPLNHPRPINCRNMQYSLSAVLQECCTNRQWHSYHCAQWKPYFSNSFCLLHSRQFFRKLNCEKYF
jgi:hypothetical protein